jgi:hypothetical protein
LDDQVKKTEMGRTCGTYGGEERRNLREGDHMKEPGMDERIILKWIFERLAGVHGLDRSGSGQGQVAGSCEYSHEPSGSTKRGQFLE